MKRFAFYKVIFYIILKWCFLQQYLIAILFIGNTIEHVETIYEIGMLYKEFATKSGIKTFRRVPALNTDKFLIQALYNQVLNALESNKTHVRYAVKKGKIGCIGIKIGQKGDYRLVAHDDIKFVE